MYYTCILEEAGTYINSRGYLKLPHP